MTETTNEGDYQRKGETIKAFTMQLYTKGERMISFKGTMEKRDRTRVIYEQGDSTEKKHIDVNLEGAVIASR